MSSQGTYRPEADAYLAKANVEAREAAYRLYKETLGTQKMLKDARNERIDLAIIAITAFLLVCLLFGIFGWILTEDWHFFAYAVLSALTMAVLGGAETAIYKRKTQYMEDTQWGR